RVFFAGWAQNASWLIRRRRRSSTDIARTPRVPPPTAFQPHTAASPPILRSCSVKTGPYSIQCPSASMIGWSRRDLIWAGVRWALTGTSLSDVAAAPLLFCDDGSAAPTPAQAGAGGTDPLPWFESCKAPPTLLETWPIKRGYRNRGARHDAEGSR